MVVKELKTGLLKTQFVRDYLLSCVFPKFNMSRPEEGNGSIHFVADQANLQGQQNAFQHDTTAAMASVLECMTLQRSTFHIPCFDGRNPPLKEFLQDVANGAVFITEQTEPGFIKLF